MRRHKDFSPPSKWEGFSSVMTTDKTGLKLRMGWMTRTSTKFSPAPSTKDSWSPPAAKAPIAVWIAGEVGRKSRLPVSAVSVPPLPRTAAELFTWAWLSAIHTPGSVESVLTQRFLSATMAGGTGALALTDD